MEAILILSLFIIMLAFYNAYIVIWGTDKDADRRVKANKMWHWIGWFVRAIPVAVSIVYFYPDWMIIVRTVAISLLLGHGLYNIIINLLRHMDWDYTGSYVTGTASWIDNMMTNTGFRIILGIEVIICVTSFLI